MCSSFREAQVILRFLEDLKNRLGMSYLFLSHDLNVVRLLCQRVLVMYLGKIVEADPVAELFERPRHPYTKALLSAVPIPDPVADSERERVVLTGDVPSPLNPPAGCVFHTRCPIAIEECSQEVPEFRNMGNDHWVACIRV